MSSFLLAVLLPTLALSQSISIIGIFSDSSCSAPYNAIPGFIMNTVLTFGQCNALPTLSSIGGGSMQVTYNPASQTFGVTGYMGTACSGSPLVSASSVPILACTMVSNDMYVQLSSAMMLGDLFMGATCGAVGTGLSTAKNSLNAVGVPGGPGACTSGATSGSILVTGQASGAYTVVAYTASGCTGSATATWTGVPMFDPSATTTATACTPSTSGSSLPLALLTYTGYVPSTPTPSSGVTPTPSLVPTAPTSSSITLIGVYTDNTCKTVLNPLDAVAKVGECGGLTGLGSGFITKGSAANTYNIVGYQGVTR